MTCVTLYSWFPRQPLREDAVLESTSDRDATRTLTVNSPQDLTSNLKQEMSKSCAAHTCIPAYTNFHEADPHFEQRKCQCLAESNHEKERNFVETVEFQIDLRKYDSQRDKRFWRTVKCVSSPVRSNTTTDTNPCRWAPTCPPSPVCPSAFSPIPQTSTARSRLTSSASLSMT